MYLGYASLIPPAASGKPSFELWNNHRNYNYTTNLLPGPEWLHECSSCDGLSKALASGLADKVNGVGVGRTTHGGDYINPHADPAPWVSVYVPPSPGNPGGWKPGPFPGASPDLLGFYGFSCISATGIETSTRSVTVVSSATNGATLGKTRYAAREMVFTLLATGLDRLSVKAGIEQLALYNDTVASCSGNNFHFYTECPCICDGPYDLPADPADPIQEPFTAQACLDQCIEKYLRCLAGVRITGGPNVLQWLDVNCGGAAILELTLTAADPRFRPGSCASTQVAVAGLAGVPYQDAVAAPTGMKIRDPWTMQLIPPPPPEPRLEGLPYKWYRTKVPVDMANKLPSLLSLRLDAIDSAPDGVRVSLLGEGNKLGSWFLRRIPEGGSVDINLATGEQIVEYGGKSEIRRDLVLGVDGYGPLWLAPVNGSLTLFVDQAAQGRMQVAVSAVEVM